MKFLVDEEKQEKGLNYISVLSQSALAITIILGCVHSDLHLTL